MIIVIADFVVRHEDDPNEPKVLGKLALLCAPPLYLILKQPNLSTTLDIVFIILAIVSCGRIKLKADPESLIIGIPFCSVYMVCPDTGTDSLESHQVARIMSF